MNPKQKIISLPQCLRIMETGASFSLCYVKYDRKRKTGGELRDIQARLVMSENKPKAIIEGRPMTPREQKLEELNQVDNSRKPNHRLWYTRNVEVFVNGHPTGRIVKVHPPLFVEFNGMKVVP
jgi:hypothetical protein